MITCAIIDDEPLALDLLENYVNKTPFLQLEGKYSSAVEAMGGLRANPVSLLFLDIQMPDLSGLEFSKIVPQETRVIFTTAFSQYAIDSYKVNAIDYLLKPINYSEFLAAANKAHEAINLQRAAADASQSNSLFVKSDYKIIRIQYADILYIEGLKDYVKIYLASTAKPILSLTSMHAVESHLPREAFMRIHRSYIVNMEKVKFIERGQVGIGDKYLPISDSYKEQVQEYVNKRMLQGR